MKGFKNERYERTIYLAHGGSGSGNSANDPLPISSAAIADVEDGVVIEAADMVITTAVAGATAVTVGDGTDADGYIAAADVTLGTPAAYAGGGALLPGYYAADDTIDVAVTGTSSAGALAIVLKGYRV